MSYIYCLAAHTGKKAIKHIDRQKILTALSALLKLEKKPHLRVKPAIGYVAIAQVATRYLLVEAEEPMDLNVSEPGC